MDTIYDSNNDFILNSLIGSWASARELCDKHQLKLDEAKARLELAQFELDHLIEFREGYEKMIKSFDPEFDFEKALKEGTVRTNKIVRNSTSTPKSRIRFGFKEKVKEWITDNESALDLDTIKALSDNEAGKEVPIATIKNRLNDLIREGVLEKIMFNGDSYYAFSEWFKEGRILPEYEPLNKTSAE